MCSKLHLFFRELWLGWINGLGFGVLAELAMRLLFAYDEVVAQRTLDPNTRILMSPYPWAWWYLPLLSLVLTSIATLLVYAFWRSHIKSVTWRWQLVGFLAVLELYVLTLARDLWNANFSELKSYYWQFAYSIKLLPWIILIPTLLAYNFLFGWATKQLGGRRERQ
jgi:hypothetical protein